MKSAACLKGCSHVYNLGLKSVDQTGAIECPKCNQWSKMSFRSSVRIGVVLSAMSALFLRALALPEWWSFICLGIMIVFAKRLAPIAKGGEPRELWSPMWLVSYNSREFAFDRWRGTFCHVLRLAKFVQ
jgi:hypothetical protein